MLSKWFLYSPLELEINEWLYIAALNLNDNEDDDDKQQRFDQQRHASDCAFGEFCP